MDYSTAAAGSMGVGALRGTNALNTPKQSAMSEHANRLHAQAEEFAALNARLESIIDRLSGPTPEAAGNAPATPAPNGVLYVAQFGAERIGLQINRLANTLSRLENIA